eukprot:jgi/Psemu1/284745/fgenesh1_pg.63_\
MVSSLSSRLFAGSRGSSSSNASPQNKRNASGSMKSRNGLANDKNDSSVSGYSADRDCPSYPPVVSINLHSKSKASFRGEALACPKRRKKNEMQFVANTVKADLARAGKEFKTVDKNLQRSTILKDLNINLKNHVRLLHSSDVTQSLVPSSDVVQKSTIAEYAALINMVSGFYPSKPSRMSDIKSFERALPAGQNIWSEPSSSSVSDTLSDSGSDNTNNSLPPLLEGSLDPSIKQVKKKDRVITTADPSNNISSVSNAITMTEILQLSKTARVVTESSAPFSIIHANAAFHRLSEKKSPLIGTPFFTLLDPETTEENFSLASLMTSPTQGGEHKLCLPPRSPVDESEPVICKVRVSPVLDQRTLIHGIVNVEYFVVEFVSEGKEFDESSITAESFSDNKTPMGVVA